MKKIVIIGKTWPESGSTGAGVRMIRLLTHFLQNKFEVIFCSAAQPNELSDNLEQFNIKSFKIQMNNPDFNDLMLTLHPDFVVFDRFTTEEQFGWRVREVLPNTVTILDTEDLHSLRRARQLLIEQKGFPFSTEDEYSMFLSNEISYRELAAIYRCDINLIISSYEYAFLLKNGIPSSILFYLPMSSASKISPINTNSFEHRKDFLFFGNFNHAPNIDALQQIHLLFPKIKDKIPSAEMHIYGEYLKNHELKKYKNSIFYHGWTPAIEEKVYSAKILLAPLRFGAGLKSKLIEALRQGTPVASTKIGFEGLCEGDDVGISGSLDSTWVNRTIDLYQEKSLWEKASKKARDYYKNIDFQLEQQEDLLLEKLMSVQNNLTKHRLKNTVGTILQLEQLKSYKFMSKYIEEKNKRRSTTK